MPQQLFAATNASGISRDDEHPNFPSPQVQDVPTWLLEAGMGWQSRLVNVEREEGGPVKLVRYNIEVHVLFFVDYWQHLLKLRTSQTVFCVLRSFATQLVMFLLYSLMCDLVNLGRWCGGIRYKWERESQNDLVKIWQASHTVVKVDGQMAQLPKVGLVRGHDEPIHGSCAIYFPGGIRIEAVLTWKCSNFWSMDWSWNPCVLCDVFEL